MPANAPNIGDKVMYRDGEVARKAEVVRVYDDAAVVDVAVYGDDTTMASHGAGHGGLIFGKERAALAATSAERELDGRWWPERWG